MKIMPIPAFTDNYIWMMQSGSRAAVVDPGDAKPVLASLEKHGLTLDTIIVTHHHFDHTGGVETLRAETGCRVVGPTNPKIEGVDEMMTEGMTLDVLGVPFSVIEVPGHTLDHIAFYSAKNNVLFCGDTLFVGGCGRVFEGTYPMMQQSLAKLASLPSETAVYCTHEYTLANLNFALKVEPKNEVLLAHIDECRHKRSQNIPTVPSTVGHERETNPFLRWESPNIAKELQAAGRFIGNAPSEVFGAIRAWKDEG